jgi:hypothetical protein
MSSPSNTPPIDPSDWAPRATRERLSAAANSDPLGSSHAPERGDEHGGAERPAVDAATAADSNGDESRKDVDLARLEDSLRWLQRQDAADRLPRVTPLPLVPGLTPPDTPRYSREEASRRRAKSLEPEPMPPPPAAPRRRYLRASLALITTSIAVAAAGYYAGRAGWWPPTNLLSAGQVATSAPPNTTASAAPIAARDNGPATAREDDPDTLRAGDQSDRERGLAQLAKLSERGTTEMAPAGEPVAQVPPANEPLRTFDPEEIKLLLKQGEQFAGAGDLASARVVLQRAAQAGDATAALALGATYDPIVLAQIGAVGFAADVEQARGWYQKAENLGSAEATRRLQALVNR